MKRKLALVTILTFLFVVMAGFVPALAEDGLGEWLRLADSPEMINYQGRSPGLILLAAKTGGYD